MKTSYQKRKNEIKYLEQCVEELEELALHLGVELVKNEGKVMVMFGQGLSGDQFITPYNNGEFNSELLVNSQKGK